MIYERAVRFKKAYKALPKEIQAKADKALLLFVQNPPASFAACQEDERA